MDVSGDHGLLVVSLENCSTDAARQLGKSNSCIYTAAMTNSPCGHETSVLQLATPVQCIGDVRQTLPRIQHQHLTQLQPLQYPQVTYEPNQQLHQHSNLVPNHTLYQPMNVSAASIHHYTAPAQQSIHSAYISTGQTLHLTPTVPESFNPQPPLPAASIEHTQNSESDSVIVNLEPDPSIEPTFPEDSYEYYKEIQCFLLSEEYPQGVSENYKKHLRKRAQHYTIIDGKLYHGRKQPKEVIMKKDEQQELLNQIHIIKETGVHLGVKKMFNKLHLKQFWRGMYIDVVTFVKNCDKCSDVVDVVRRRQKEGPYIDEDEEEDVDDPAPAPPPRPRPTCLRTRSQCTDAPQAWRKVEVKLHGPYKKTSNRNEYVVSIADPDSRWFCARAIPSSGHPTHMAEFIFHTFCNYGFTRCVLVGITNDLMEAISEDYRWRVHWLGEMFTTACLSSVELHQSQCVWVEPLLDLLMQAHPVKWDKELDHFLFQYRTGKLKEFSLLPSPTPFSVIFNHNPINSSISDDDKENIDESSTPRRRKLQSSVLQCRHCDEVFTSKISFRIHQRKHTEEARKRGRESGEAVRKIRRPDGKRNRRGLPRLLRTSEEGVQFKTPDTWVESTVSAVKALLVATKEERRRRGKYHKYTTELQEQMAAYAVQHGNPQAVRYFSERLGTMVSESTIRNLVKIHSAFTPLLKEEIGRFAANFGVEPASKYFSDRLKRDVPLSLVRKFKTLHLNKFPDNSKRQRDKKTKKERIKKGIILKKSAVIGTGKAKRYSQKIKEEIGFYACHYSVAETVKHFSEKLQILVKERTVKRFHKAYLEKCQLQNGAISNNHVDAQVVEQTHQMNQPAPAYNSPFTQHINNTQAAVYQMNQCNSNTNNISYQTPATSLIMTQTNSSFNYHTVNTIQNYPTSIPPPPMPPPPLYPLQPAVIRHSEQQTPIGTITITQQDQVNPSCLLSQHPILVTQERHDSDVLPHFMVSNQQAQHLQTQQVQQIPQAQQLTQQSQQLPQVQHLTQSQQLPQQPQQQPQQSQQLPQQSQQLPQQLPQQAPQQSQQLSQATQLPQQSQQLSQATQLSQQSQQLSQAQQLPQQAQQLLPQQLLPQQAQQLSQQQTQPLPPHQQDQQQQQLTQHQQQQQSQKHQQQQSQQPQQHQQPQTVLSIMQDKQPLKELQPMKCEGNSSIVQNHLHHDFSTENFHQANDTITRCIPVVTELLIHDDKVDMAEVLINENKQDTEVNAVNTNQRLAKTCESTLPSEGREKQAVCSKGNRNSNRKQGKKKESSSKKRGSYTTYSPELRAEIGKYAAEHGSLKACQYFSKILGHDVPESTARGLKDKYLMKRKHCTVTSLGYSQRGRPLRLGKYDEVVQECLKELVRSGEKVSSFLAITTAKQILNKYDPSLLEDNGGPVKLNTTWAKSFLKRIGVHNNS